MNELVKCVHCGKEYSKMGIGTHIWRNHTETEKLFTENNTNNKNRIYTSSWSKGLTKETSASIRKSAETLKSRFKTGELKHYFKDKIHKDETKLKISESKKEFHRINGPNKGIGYGKSGWYQNFWCDSSYELAFVIYNLENGIKFERNKVGFDYIFENKTFKYFPDFIIENNSFVEIKGRDNFSKLDLKNQQKIIQFQKPLKVLYNPDMKIYLDYVIQKYGKNFIELYKDYKKPEKIVKLPKKPITKLVKEKVLSEFKIKKISLIEKRKQLILKSDIDFSKFGWVNEIANLTGLLTQKVNSFMKKHLSEIYENKCFKRK